MKKNKENYLQKELYQLMQTDRKIWEFLEEGCLDGIWYWDLENQDNEWMSPKFWENFGYNPKKKKHDPKEWQTLIHPDDLQATLKNFKAHYKDPKNPYDQIVRYTRKDGNISWVKCRGIIIRNSTGKPIRMLGVHIDITEEKRIEKKLVESERKFHNAFKYSGIGMALVSTEGKWMQVNQSLCKIVGYNEKELLKITFQEITHSDDLDKDLHFVQEMIDLKRDSYQMKKRYYHKKGHIIWVLLNVSAVKDENNNLLYFVSQIQDITEKILTEEELIKSETKYKKLLNSIINGIYIFNFEKKKVEFINQQYENISGWSLEDLQSMNEKILQKTSSPENHKALEEHFQDVQNSKRNKAHSIEFLMKKKNSEWIWCLSHTTPYERDKDGKVIKSITSIIDISKRKKIEIELEQTMKKAKKMNTFMIGREVKMAKLKKKIKELEKQIKSSKK